MIPASLGPDCAAHYATYAAWNVWHSSYGTSDIFIFDKKSSVTNSFYDWEHYGTYFVEPRNSWSNFFEPSQNFRSYVVKSGSGIRTSAVRVGPHVLLSLATSYNSPAAHGYRMWPKAKVQLQYRTCPTCRWTYLRTLGTASNGRVAFAVRSPRIRYYRAVSAAAPTVWGRTSAAVRR